MKHFKVFRIDLNLIFGTRNIIKNSVKIGIKLYHYLKQSNCFLLTFQILEIICNKIGCAKDKILLSENLIWTNVS